MKKTRVIYLIIIVLILLFVPRIILKMVDRFSNSNNYREKVELSYRQKSFTGIIEDKYIDRNEHMRKKIVIKEGEYEKIFLLNSEIGIMYDYLKIGDSIAKERGSLEVEVFRQNFDTILRIKLVGVD